MPGIILRLTSNYNRVRNYSRKYCQLVYLACKRILITLVISSSLIVLDIDDLIFQSEIDSKTHSEK